LAHFVVFFLFCMSTTALDGNAAAIGGRLVRLL